MLVIENLCAEIEEQSILKGIDLEVKKGEIHAIMGPNGAGKSTLGKVLAGDPSYQVSGGKVELEGEGILELEPEERAQKGLFLGFQYPVEIPGVTNLQFCHAAYKSVSGEKVSEEFVKELLEEKCELLGFSKDFLSRGINEGFSGGEKKRNEILQMALLDPKCAVLDETDSGLDIDALRIVAEGIEKIHNENKGLILITHYQRLLESIKPDVVHVMIDGKIVMSGAYDLALKLEEHGYDWLKAGV